MKQPFQRQTLSDDWLDLILNTVDQYHHHHPHPEEEKTHHNENEEERILESSCPRERVLNLFQEHNSRTTAEDVFLCQLDNMISNGLQDFTTTTNNNNIQNNNTSTRPHSDLVQSPSTCYATTTTTTIPEHPSSVTSIQDTLYHSILSNAVPTGSPRFIGHMTSALPRFMIPLTKLMTGLNQNVVKVETSQGLTQLERQTIGMLHQLAYGKSEEFYQTHLRTNTTCLGSMCSGGTVANMTALWVARNNLMKPIGDFQGIHQDGLVAGMLQYGYKGLAVLVSERGHYSLAKAADVLGIGRRNVISVPCNGDTNKVNVSKMREMAKDLQSKGIQVMALVGIAGTTETGTIDPLNDIADLARDLGCHFHVDAAWGGATLFSNTYRSLYFQGIERADSITIDAHKQLYTPMGAGAVLFQNPYATQTSVVHHANYILRKGSNDLGIHTLEGSRPAMAMILYMSFQILGRSGYELLIEESIHKAQYFANLIEAQPDFEVISKPELCIFTYRIVPIPIQQQLELCNGHGDSKKLVLYELLNDLTESIQERQREAGHSFVSRTRLNPSKYNHYSTVVFRVVLANPLTTHEMLHEVLQEQRTLVESDPIYQKFLLMELKS